ncbi:MAG: hypothetical protein ABSG76_24970 [Xanthobacteraceae bacterium]
MTKRAGAAHIWARQRCNVRRAVGTIRVASDIADVNRGAAELGAASKHVLASALCGSRSGANAWTVFGDAQREAGEDPVELRNPKVH